MEKEDYEKIFYEVIEKYRHLHDEVHSSHHAFIETMIKREERRQERLEKIKTQVGGWGVIIFLGFMGKVVWNFVEKQLR